MTSAELEVAPEGQPDDPVVAGLIEDELPEIVDLALADPDVKQSYERLSLVPAQLRDRLLADPMALLSPTNPQIAKIRDTARKLQEYERKKLAPIIRTDGGSPLLRACYRLGLAVLAPVLVVAATFASGWVIRGWAIHDVQALILKILLVSLAALVGSSGVLRVTHIQADLTEPATGSTAAHTRAARVLWKVTPLAAGLALAFVAVLLWSYSVRLLTAWAAVPMWAFALLVISSVTMSVDQAAQLSPALRELRDAVTTARERWREAARQTVDVALKRLINEVAAPSYGTTLSVRDDRGLGMLAADEFVVDTRATRTFKAVLGRLEGGAVGVAGPRGTGKTTLLTAYGDGLFLEPGRRHLLIEVDAPIGYEGRDFALHLYATSCDAVIDHVNRLMPTRRRFRRRSKRAKPLREMRKQAHQRLERIRYLQTRTTGWSGSLTSPVVKLDMQVSRSTAEARLPLSYPEIVADLRGYLADTAEELAKVSPNSARTPLVVMIDELDKIESADQAQRFVNELKALFGIRGCHFVVSVSEDALTAFERRGLPVRDAFDSAFDEVIRIEHLRLDESRRVIGSRLIGLPEPFLCLCHCLSGGLPRDLIRVARAMMDVALAGEDEPAPSLATVSWVLVMREVLSACRAAQRALAPMVADAQVNELIRLADPARWRDKDPATVVATVDDLAATVKADDPRELSAVRLELMTYLYFCGTLLEVFDDGLVPEKTVETAVLALARQEFGENLLLVWQRITQFRESWGLRLVSWPS